METANPNQSGPEKTSTSEQILQKRKKAAEIVREIAEKRRAEEERRRKEASKERKLPWLKAVEKKTQDPKEISEPKPDNSETPKSPETGESLSIQERKRAYLKEKTVQEAAVLEQKLSMYPPGSEQNAQAQAELEVVQELSKKAMDPDIEVDPAIDEEYDRRMEAISEEDLVAFEQQKEESDVNETNEENPLFSEDASLVRPTLPTARRMAGRYAKEPAAPTAPNSISSAPYAKKAQSADTVLPIEASQPTTNESIPQTSAEDYSSPDSGVGGDRYVPPTTSANYLEQYTKEPPKPTEQLRRPEQRPRSGPVAAGALIGYAIGRRSGAKRTDQKLKPKIESLQKEAQNAQQEVAKTQRHYQARQAGLKSAVAARHQEVSPVTTGVNPPTAPVAETRVHQQSAMTEEQATVKIQRQQQQPEHQAPQIIETQQQPDYRVPQTIETRRQPESYPRVNYEASVPLQYNQEKIRKSASALPLHEAPRQTFEDRQNLEKIAESTPKQAHQQTEHSESGTTEKVSPKKFEQMNTQEIIQMAESIHIGGVSIRRLYETNQIDRSGLIKIVKESMRGGDIKTVFENVKLGQERQRERVHEFQHGDGAFTSTSSSAAADAQQTPQTVLPAQPTQEEASFVTAAVPQPLQESVKPLNIADSQESMEEKKSQPNKPPLPIIPLMLFIFGIILIILWLLNNL